MRILLIQKDLFERTLGGSDYYALQLARTLAGRHEVRVVCTNPARGPSRGPRRIEWQGLPTLELPANRDLHPGSAAGRTAEIEVSREIESVRPDVVHVNEIFMLSPGILPIARASGAVVVHTLHEFFLVCPRLILRTTSDRLCRGPSASGCFRCGHDMARERYVTKPRPGEGFRDRLKRVARVQWNRRATELDFAVTRRGRFRRAAAAADVLLCPSAFLRDVLVAEGIPGERMRVFGYALPGREPVRPDTPSDRLRVGFVGNPARHKGIFVLLEAARLAPAAEFTIYGKLPSDVADEVNRQVERLDNVRLAGILEDHAKAEAYRSIDVLAVPSIWYENQPFTMLEAFQFGTPVVASRLGGMAELLERGGGWLFDPGRPDALAKLLRDLADDREHLSRARESIPAVPTMEEHVRELERIYEEVRKVRGLGGRGSD